MRARLGSRGAGKWVESTGDRSKFGLSASEIVAVVNQLRSEDMLDCFEMLHFHIGSQITEIRAHADALQEASRIFTGLHKLGAPVKLIDCGGGLAACAAPGGGMVCADVRVDASHCGGCGKACPVGTTCLDGSCCAAGHAACFGQCRDLESDAAACGGCGIRCDDGARCVKGKCVGGGPK